MITTMLKKNYFLLLSLFSYLCASEQSYDAETLGVTFKFPPQIVTLLNYQKEKNNDATDLIAATLNTSNEEYSVTFPLLKTLKIKTPFSELIFKNPTVSILKDKNHHYSIDINNKDSFTQWGLNTELTFQTENHSKQDLDNAETIDTSSSFALYRCTHSDSTESIKDKYSSYQRNLLLVKENEKVIGFCIFTKFKHTTNNNDLYINSIQVAEDKQKKGIGSSMIRYLINTFYPESIKLISLGKAKGFYKKIGFKKSASDPYMKKQIDELTLSDFESVEINLD